MEYRHMTMLYFWVLSNSINVVWLLFYFFLLLHLFLALLQLRLNITYSLFQTRDTMYLLTHQRQFFLYDVDAVADNTCHRQYNHHYGRCGYLQLFAVFDLRNGFLKLPLYLLYLSVFGCCLLQNPKWTHTHFCIRDIVYCDIAFGVTVDIENQCKGRWILVAVKDWLLVGFCDGVSDKLQAVKGK